MCIFHFFYCWKKNIETPNVVTENAVILSDSDINKMGIAMINPNEGYGFCITDSVNIIKGPKLDDLQLDNLKLDKIKKSINIL